MALEISGTIIKAELEGNFLVLDVDGTKQYPAFNATFTHIAALSSNHIVLEDGAKGSDKAWKIPLANYYESDGITAINTEAKAVTYLSAKIGS